MNDCPCGTGQPFDDCCGPADSSSGPGDAQSGPQRPLPMQQRPQVQEMLRQMMTLREPQTGNDPWQTIVSAPSA